MSTEPTKEFLNFTEYSRHRGVSDVMVHKAVREGKIVEGLVRIEGRKMIDWKKADAEWDQHKNPARPRATKGSKAAPLLEQKPDPGSYAEAKRFKELLTAKKLELEIKKREGKLVDKDGVYRALYAYGQEIRMNLESLPDRVIDNILANANDRHTAKMILVAEIEHILLDLSKAPKLG